MCSGWILGRLGVSRSRPDALGLDAAEPLANCARRTIAVIRDVPVCRLVRVGTVSEPESCADCPDGDVDRGRELVERCTRYVVRDIGTIGNFATAVGALAAFAVLAVVVSSLAIRRAG